MKLCMPLYLTAKEEGKSAILDVSYQASMLSLIKRGLSKSNPELFGRLYKHNTMKNFAMSVYFPHATFMGKKIILGQDKNAELFFTSNDLNMSLNYFNAFQKLAQLGKFTFNADLDVTVGRTDEVIVPTIKSSGAIFQTMSPLVVRNADKRFVSCSGKSATPEFEQALKAVIKTHLSNQEFEPLVDEMLFIPIKMKKTVMQPFGEYVEASTGMFELIASPTLLNELLNNGIGTKKGSFAGMIRLVEEVDTYA